MQEDRSDKLKKKKEKKALLNLENQLAIFSEYKLVEPTEARWVQANTIRALLTIQRYMFIFFRIYVVFFIDHRSFPPKELKNLYLRAAHQDRQPPESPNS